MNHNVLFIRDKSSHFSEKIAEELKPSQKIILQFSYYNQVCIAREYKNNILIPRIPRVKNLSFPISYKLLSHVLVSNDLDKDVLDSEGIEAIKLPMCFNANSDKLKISNVFDNYYKYGCILNFQQDMGVLKDLIPLFYHANRYRHNTLLVLSIESQDSQRVLSFIEDIHKHLNINPAYSKLILSINDTIDDNSRISIINTIDCLLQINSVFVSDLEYYYALSQQKRIIGKYNLDKNYEIETIPYQNQLFQFENRSNFFQKFDDHALYEKLKICSPLNLSKNQIYSSNNSTGISNIIL